MSTKNGEFGKVGESEWSIMWSGTLSVDGGGEVRKFEIGSRLKPRAKFQGDGRVLGGAFRRAFRSSSGCVAS